MFLRKNWLPISVLLVATITVALQFTSATQTPCRRPPLICQPETQPPPCESICPYADKWEHTRTPEL